MIDHPPPPVQAKARPAIAATSALALVALAALLARAAASFLDASSLALFFVAPVVLLAIRFGFVASLGGALLSTLVINFLFVEPLYSLSVARPQDAAALVVFIAVAAMVSAIAAQAREQAYAARLRAWEATLLRDYARTLVGDSDESEIIRATLAAATHLTNGPTALVAANGATHGAALDRADIEAALWCMSTKQAFAPSAEAPTPTIWSFWPVLVGAKATYALGVAATLTPERAVPASQIAVQAGAAFERLRVAALAEQARLDAKREALKSELLAGVSHDLRTPLSTLVFTLQSLQRFATEHTSETREELLTLAEQEAQRLASLVESLLDASRLEAGASPVQLEQIAPLSLVEQAAAQAQIAASRLSVSAPDALPLVTADPVLATRALANVLENATRHADANAPIEIDLHRDGASVLIEIKDRGPGIGDDPERLFQKFVRGVNGDGRAPGLGLGLPIARGLLESQGGALTARNREGGGALFTARLACADG